MRLEGNRVIVGVCGGISAYKICELVRLLKKSGFDVQVVMTKNATRFVSPETFRVLSQREVLVDAFDATDPSRVEHVQLPDECDLFVVAPATANTIAKMAAGIADNMLTCMFLANRRPVLLCPAMNHKMYEHPATQRNLEILRGYGVEIMEPDEGALACGTSGRGRLPEPERIYERIVSMLSVKDYAGKRVLVTAGPTREHIDPVRFLSNPSSGKMGYAIARAALRRGAEVVLVTGPVSIDPPEGVEVVEAVSARQMHAAVMERVEETDVFIMAAAVADYRPKVTYDSKIKKEKAALDVLELERNPDIIADVAAKKRDHQIVVGFAAETERVFENALEKMKRKGMDMIVANNAVEAFGKEENRVILIRRDGITRYLPQMSKLDVADEILDEIMLLCCQ